MRFKVSNYKTTWLVIRKCKGYYLPSKFFKVINQLIHEV